MPALFGMGALTVVARARRAIRAIPVCCRRSTWWTLGLLSLAQTLAPQPLPIVAAQPKALVLLPKDAGPLQTQTPLTVVRERVQRGDTDGALEALDALSPKIAQRADLRYLRARLLANKDRIHEALATLPDDTSALPPVVARDIQIRRALWLARTGHCTEARPMLTALAKYDGPDAELALRAADCALVQSDPASALVLLRDARDGGTRRFALRLTLAKVLATTGDRATAVHELKALYVRHPEHPRIDEVEAQLRELIPDWTPSNEEHFARAEHWLSAADPESALDELQAIRLPKPRGRRQRREHRKQLARIAHIKGMALFRMRTRYPEAAQVLAQAAALGGAHEASDGFNAARALARADRDAEAVRAYRRFARRHRRSPLGTDALHDAAWLELRHDMPGGEAHMQTVLREAGRHKLKHTVREALWDLAIHAYESGHCERGLPLFERYSGAGNIAMIKARGLYWAGRCAMVLGKRALALAHFREAQAVEPLHWYALLSQAQIAALGEDPGPAFPIGDAQPAAAVDSASDDDVPLPAAVAFYAQLGLVEDARAILRRQETVLRDHQEDDGLPLLVAAYHKLGEYTRPYLLALRERDDVLMRPPNPADWSIWDALFPRPYAREVAFAASGAEISEQLVYAVIRKESAFNASVVSSANAIGLMQLIERTAKRNAKELGMRDFDRSLLYDPATNVMLGSHYLAKLLARYKGQAVPAIAAYNAGEHRVDPWLRRAAKPGKTVDVDWFVEDIPIDQTRNYVRRVVCSWARYEYLKNPGHWTFTLPLTLKL